MKKWIFRIVAATIGVVLIVLGGGYLWLQFTVKKSLPQITGRVSVGGIKQEVEIIRDKYGVPHIYAQNEPDLYFGLGYAMAQDRLWQMEFHRRLGHGRLSEIFGEEFVQTDRYFRLLGAAGINNDFPDELSFMLDSLAAGINAYLTSRPKKLPIEFKLLRFDPEPWQPEDYLAILKVVNWGLSMGWRVDLTAGKILEKVGEQKFREAFPVWPGNSPIYINRDSTVESSSFNSIQKLFSTIENTIAVPSPAASNNWVISGQKSTTGKPILANDPHLTLSNPSFWWEAHLVCPTINLSGFGIPGVPGIPMGHNQHVAWGVTNVMVDDVDFFIEKLNPDNSHQYLYKGSWEDMRVIEETIRIKGKEPHKTKILLTRHGPLLTDISKSKEKTAIAVKWAFNDGLQPAKAAYLLAKAKNFEDIRQALTFWELPSQNFVFADSAGNIGYWCSATVPLRSKGDGFLPVQGWSGEYEWNGYVPFEKRPHIINPANEYIATANTKVSIDGFRHFISNYYEPVDRITRINQLLQSKDKLSVDDMKNMQKDIYCLLASELTPQIIQVLETKSENDDAKIAKEILSQWNFMMEKDSVGASLFELTYRNMIDNIFKDELGDELFRKYLETTVFAPRAIRHMIQNASSPWFDDIRTQKMETKEDIIFKSAEQAISQLISEHGKDPANWVWGKQHGLTFEHPLGKKKPLNYIFNIGPFPVGGSHLTVNKRQYPYNTPFDATSGVSYRMIVDFFGYEQFPAGPAHRSIRATGQRPL